jgi:SAM-dependent methyltransferase
VDATDSEHGAPRPEKCGTGPRSPDGWPVELYRRLPAGDTPALLHAAMRAGGTVLELGAGAGRLVHPLIALGHPVTAVDHSPEMLSYITGATTVLSRIEDLALDQTFDAIVLATYLINTPDRHQRDAFLRTCRRHVAPDGVVLIDRQAPAHFDVVQPGRRIRDDQCSETLMVERDGSYLTVHSATEYAGQRWSQSFVAYRLEDPELDASLRQARLMRCRWLSSTWFTARPTTAT